MKRVYIYLISLLAINFSFGQVQINEIYLFPYGNSSSVERFIELKNVSSFSEVDISNYKICAYSKGKASKECAQPSSHKKETLYLSPGEVVYLKINRTQAHDNFIYLELDHSNKSLFSLYDDKNQKLDEIDILTRDRSMSISRKEGSSATWSETKPTKGKINKYDNYHSFQYLPKLNNEVKKKKNGERELDWGNEDLEKDSYSQYESDLKDIEEEDTIAKGKIVINEVFFIHEPNGFVNKDYWVELYNNSETYINLTSLSLSTDTLYEKSVINSNDTDYGEIQISPGSYVTVNISEKATSNDFFFKAPLEDRSSSIYLMQGASVVDSITVEPLERHQTYSRTPDKTGMFKVVDLETPDKENTQLLPSYNTVSKLTLYHSLGLSFNNYNQRNTTDVTRPRFGYSLGFGWERPKKHLLTRYNFLYQRQSFGIKIDSVLNTDFGTVNINTSGFTKAEYIKFNFEIGVPVVPNFNIFLGGGMSILMSQFTEVSSITTATFLTGEVFEETDIIDDKNGYVVDNLELDLSIGLEYQVKNNVYFNLSYSRDYFSLRFNGADLLNHNQLTNDQILLKLIVPLYQSYDLKRKSFLLNRYATKKFN